MDSPVCAAEQLLGIRAHITLAAKFGYMGTTMSRRVKMVPPVTRISANSVLTVIRDGPTFSRQAKVLATFSLEYENFLVKNSRIFWIT